MTFPDLSGEKEIALDLETYDPDLKKLGPGPRRKNTFILGAAICTRKKKWYFSLAHPESENLNKSAFFKWMRGLQGKTIYGANLLYDFDFLQYHHFKPSGKICDVQFAEPLIDENRFRYDLDSVGKKYLNIGKQKTEIEKICELNGWKGDPRKYLYMMPADVVGRYAMQDASMCFDIFDRQKKILESENLEPVYDLESELIPLYLDMRKHGIRVDETKRRKLKIKYGNYIVKKTRELKNIAGFSVNVNAPRSVQKLFDKLKIPYFNTEPTERFPEGQPSFTADFLESCPHPAAALVLDIRHKEKMLGTFIDGVERFMIGDRLHTLFNPLKSTEDFGTVSGRFSSKFPNFQQIPKRDEEAKKDIRGMYLPEENYSWYKLDYKQEEMVIFVHYCKALADMSHDSRIKQHAEKLVKMYIENENADVYKIVAGVALRKQVEKITKAERTKYKTTSLGILYGMTTDKLGRSHGIITKDKPDRIYIEKYWKNIFADVSPLSGIPDGYESYFKEYKKAYKILRGIHDRFPLFKHVSNECQAAAKKYGYVKTILGRRRRFKDNFYKAFNGVDQGSGGDIIKLAMLKAYKAGVFEIAPLLATVHDELDVSAPNSRAGESAVKELKNICETCVSLHVPLRLDVQKGPNWAGK
jgi:DNA polymerase I-like protein with 3'-5' exonuclease and polymerase domains